MTEKKNKRTRVQRSNDKNILFDFTIIALCSTDVTLTLCCQPHVSLGAIWDYFLLIKSISLVSIWVALFIRAIT